MLGCFFNQHIDNLIIFYFSLYLDYIEVYLNFNYNYNLVLTEKILKKIVFFN